MKTKRTLETYRIRGRRGKFQIIGPDEIPLTPKPFNTRQAARDFIPVWCARYTQQGHYSAASGQRIGLADLPDHCRIFEV